MTTTLRIEGMTCSNCVRHVREAILSVPEVAYAEVDLADSRAKITWKEAAPTDRQPVLRAVQEAGYGAEVMSSDPASSVFSSGTPWNVPLLLGSVVSVFLMLSEWVFPWHREPWFGWIAFSATLPVMAIAGGPFYQGAWRQLKQHRLNMDTLVVLGSTAAFGLSLYGLWRPEKGEHLYFMEASAIITFISLGHWLEARVSQMASRTLRGMLSATPSRARRLRQNQEEEVPVALLQADDFVLLKPGDRVPIDGVVTEHESTVDESMLTGEARPVAKVSGAKVYAGTLNLSGKLIIRVASVGTETALARITGLVRTAQDSRAAIQHFVDRISSVFVFIVIVIATLTLFGWGTLSAVGWERALINAIAVLVVACPCAMGLATPAAMMVAANAAARRGLLIRDADALEKCGRVTAVLFDKTGTLTEPFGMVTAVKKLAGEEKEWAPLIHALAAPSQHPLSRTLAEHYRSAAKETGCENWQEERGRGVSALWQKQIWRLGSVVWLRENGVIFPSETGLEKYGIGLARGEELLGLFMLEARLKKHAKTTMEQLRAQGLKIFLVSGDGLEAAQIFAKEAAIQPEEIFANVRPEGKASIVRELQARGEKVAFVGDGMNDAPALARADLGIAVTQATDLAREAADVILLRPDIEAIPEVLGLSAATLRTIKQNLFWAFFYNAAAVPLAAGGFVSPILCAVAMGLSDLFLVLNSLRLFLWKYRPSAVTPN